MGIDIKKKIIVSIVALLIAVVMLVGASLAWMTISANPEITNIHATIFGGRTLLLSLDGENFTEHITADELFADYVDLKPVSTIDGIHWFIPTYDKDGTLRSLNDFIMDDKLEYANVVKYKLEEDTSDKGVLASLFKSFAEGDDDDDDDGEGKTKKVELTGWELREAQDRGYYVWADIWLKSEEKNGCKVRISVPHEVNESDLDGFYGTYVLPLYELTDDKNNPIKSISKNVESSIRVGFLFMDEMFDDDPTTFDITDSKGDLPLTKDGYYDAGHNTTKKFIIFEPNADLRSKITTEEDLDNEENPFYKPRAMGEDGNPNHYIKKYQYNDDTYKDGIYIETRPVGYDYTSDLSYFKYSDYDGGKPTIDMYLGTGNVNALTYNLLSWKEVAGTNGEEKSYEFYYDKDGRTIKVFFDEFDRTFYTVETFERADHTTYEMVTQTGLDVYKREYKAIPTEIPESQLVSQLSVKWKQENLIKALQADPPTELTSKDVSFDLLDGGGRFLNIVKLKELFGNAASSGGLNTVDLETKLLNQTGGADIAGDTIVFELKDDKPVRCRMFIWIEGQDVDCWNDIAGGAFKVNIELAGESKPESGTEG